jgi:hypothetical protein
MILYDYNLKVSILWVCADPSHKKSWLHPLLVNVGTRRDLWGSAHKGPHGAAFRISREGSMEPSPNGAFGQRLEAEAVLGDGGGPRRRPRPPSPRTYVRFLT